MKENVSGYSRNPCSLNRERDAAFAAKLLTLPTGFFSAEKSEEWMARSPVWPDDVIASETASRHQPMNWRDSIWAQTRSRGRRSRCVKLATQRLVPYSENKGYASNPRRFFNLKPHKHIALHQIHKIMLFLATSYDPFKLFLTIQWKSLGFKTLEFHWLDKTGFLFLIKYQNIFCFIAVNETQLRYFKDYICFFFLSQLLFWFLKMFQPISMSKKSKKMHLFRFFLSTLQINRKLHTCNAAIFSYESELEKECKAISCEPKIA